MVSLAVVNVALGLNCWEAAMKLWKNVPQQMVVCIFSALVSVVAIHFWCKVRQTGVKLSSCVLLLNTRARYIYWYLYNVNIYSSTCVFSFLCLFEVVFPLAQARPL